jgi:kynurenine formamidase
MSKGRWKNRPEASNWGIFGPDDQRGRLNLLTSDRVLRARAEIVTGQAFCLSLPLRLPGGRVLSPMRVPPALHVTEANGEGRFNHPPTRDDGFTDIECDDGLTMSLQYSTHWDALSHVGAFFDADGDGVAEQVYYNGFRAGNDIVPHQDGLGGARALGIEVAAQTPIVGRAVMVDLHAAFGGTGRPVAVDIGMLGQALQTAPEEGDILILHTGFSDLLIEMDGAPNPELLRAGSIALDGRDPALLDWISESGIAAIASDNFAVEAYPARPPIKLPAAELPLHEHCLFKLGVILGELWNLGPLARAMAAQGRSRFFLSAPPLNLPGAVASPLTPVGIL